MKPSPCPACPTGSAPEPVERHLDRIGGKEYHLLRCAECGVVFSEPREAVGPEWYEKAAPIRALERRPDPALDWRYRTFFSERLRPGNILDVGCGDGGFLLLAKEKGWVAAGFDYERRMVELARSRGVADARACEFSEYCAGRPECEFDAISLFDVLEHTPEPGRMLSELKRLLRPGGRVVITLPNALRPLPWRREEHDFPPHHFTRWSPEAMRGFLERNGFAVERQVSSHLRVAYLSDHLFFYALMPGLLALARRLLFGESRGTLTELFASEDAPTGPRRSDWRGRFRSRLREKLLRQTLVNALKAALVPVLYPIAAAMAAYYRLLKGDSGDCLYTLARLERK